MLAPIAYAKKKKKKKSNIDLFPAMTVLETDASDLTWELNLITFVIKNTVVKKTSHEFFLTWINLNINFTLLL